MPNSHELLTDSEDFVLRAFCPDNENEIKNLVSFINFCYLIPGHWTKISALHDGPRVDADDVLRDASQLSVFVAEDSNKRIIACVKTGLVECTVVAKLSKPTGYFGLLAVHPDFQNKGLGTRLIRMSEQYCLEKGAKEMAVDMVDYCKDLFDWYIRLGYVPTGQFVGVTSVASCFDANAAKNVNFILLKKNLV